MSHQPIKKKDFYNGGKGINLEEFKSEGFTSPPLSPRDSEPPSLIPLDSSNSPIRSPDCSTHLPSSSSPPPLYPLSANFGVHPSSCYSHSSLNSSVYASTMSAYTNSLPYCLQGPPLRHFEYGGNSTTSPPASFSDSSVSQDYSCHSRNAFVGDLCEYAKVRMFDKEDNVDKSRKESEAKTRQQKCSLCFNHGLVKEKKGHKWQCAFKNCECPRCLITKGRQKTMRDQQKLTRHLQKMQL